MRRVLAWLALVALGWVACWLLPGLLAGDATALLRPHPPEYLRLPYLVGLYGWLVMVTVGCWRDPGRLVAPPIARPWALGLAAGLLGAWVHRALLGLAGAWTPPATLPLAALLVAPLLAVAEEVVFRGFLFHTLREAAGRRPAYVLSCAFFAVVHLFRPGTVEFKAAYAVGLFLAAVVLCRLTELAGSLWPAVGLHTAWILFMIGDPPGRVVPSWWAGLDGDPAAGVLGWLLLLGLLPLLPGLTGHGSSSASVRSGAVWLRSSSASSK